MPRHSKRKTPFPICQGTYDVVYADPPWSYYGDPNKMAAAGKYYALLS